MMKKKVLSIGLISCLLLALLSVACFADETTSFSLQDDVIDEVTGSLGQYLTVGNLMLVVAAVIGFTGVFFLAHWAKNKLIGTASGAIKKGRLGR